MRCFNGCQLRSLCRPPLPAAGCAHAALQIAPPKPLAQVLLPPALLPHPGAREGPAAGLHSTVQAAALLLLRGRKACSRPSCLNRLCQALRTAHLQQLGNTNTHRLTCPLLPARQHSLPASTEATSAIPALTQAAQQRTCLAHAARLSTAGQVGRGGKAAHPHTPSPATAHTAQQQHSSPCKQLARLLAPLPPQTSAALHLTLPLPPPLATAAAQVPEQRRTISSCLREGETAAVDR